VRLFLAIALPEETLAWLEALQRELAPRCAGWRWVRPQGIHLTIRFLGAVDERQEQAALGPWTEAAAAVAPFRLRLGGLGCFPPRGRPRVMWIGSMDEPTGSLERLFGRVEEATRGVGLEPERRPFRAHLTLARAARRGRPEPPPPGDWSLGEPIEARSLTLFESHLRPEGASYTVRATFPLAG
jgi:2'-5' RNA ligase